MCSTSSCVTIKSDDSLVAWCNSNGGDTPLNNSKVFTDIFQVTCSAYVCVSLNTNGSVVTGGNNSHVGDTNSLNLTNFLQVTYYQSVRGEE